MKIRYFELIQSLCTTSLRDENLLIDTFSSIELYHESGSPLVTKPSDYFKPLHEFNVRDFDFIFVLPKSLERFNIVSTQGLGNSYFHSIPIICFITQSAYTIEFYSPYKHVHVDQLKNECSRYFHLPVSCISISLEDKEHNFEHNLADKTVINFDDVLNGNYKLHFKVSEEYWEPCFLNAFRYNNYFPICGHSTDALVYLNVYLLFLVRKVKLKYSPDRVASCLGLLRKISYSPPLIHSLRLIFSENIITLPHKVALVEGLAITISLLDYRLVHMERYDLPCLWCYIEENTGRSYLEYERSQFVFPNLSLEEVEHNHRDFPQQMYIYSAYRRQFLNETRYALFPFENPIELYHNFLNNRLTTGLIRVSSGNKWIPCVFYGRSPDTSQQMIACYSPYHGRLISFNPFEIETPDRYVPSDINKHSKILIILDISNDMYNTLDGLSYIPSHISPHDVFHQLETALLLIDVIIDSLISLKRICLLGITLVSHDHSFKNGFFVFQELTLEYCYSVKRLREWIASSVLSQNPLCPPNGGIVCALSNYIEKKYSKDSHLFLFTNQHFMTRYYGSNVHSINSDIQKLHYRVNVILFGDSIGSRIEPLCRKSNGMLINSAKFISKSSKRSNDSMYYCSQFREYIDFIRDLLSGHKTENQFSNFNEVCLYYKGYLSKSDQLITKFHKRQEKSPNHVLAAILQHLSSYTHDPNPFVTMYSIEQDITRWVLFFKCPSNTSLYGTDHVLSLTFSLEYPYQPPSIRFLSPILHPNVYPNGKICLPILYEDFVPKVTTLRTIIDTILSMLSNPIRSHIINRSIGEFFLFATSTYDLQISTVKESICLKSLSRGELETSLKISPNTPVPPKYLICPLTGELYNYPVISPDGNTFERSAILLCLKGLEKDPISLNPLTEENLFPNFAIADSVLKYKLNINKASK